MRRTRMLEIAANVRRAFSIALSMDRAAVRTHHRNVVLALLFTLADAELLQATPGMPAARQGCPTPGTCTAWRCRPRWWGNQRPQSGQWRIPRLAHGPNINRDRAKSGAGLDFWPSRPQRWSCGCDCGLRGSSSICLQWLPRRRSVRRPCGQPHHARHSGSVVASRKPENVHRGDRSCVLVSPSLRAGSSGP